MKNRQQHAPVVNNRGGLARQNYQAHQGAQPDLETIARMAQLNPEMVQRLTLSTAASPFGCCNFFDQCTDEIMSLSFMGNLGLLDWMGFMPTEDCYRSLEFIKFIRPAYVEDSPTAGYISDPCADPNGIEFGGCTLTVEDFGLYGRQGPNRKILKAKKYCKTYPTYRLDGTLIESEQEWDMVFTMNTMLDDIRRALITGSTATPGQFDGLQRWVKTGYECSGLDSYVINWAGNPMTGGAGITANGNAVAPTYHFIDVLRDVNQQINQRISWSPMLRGQAKNPGDKILLLPSHWVQCLLDAFTCWFFCDGSQYNETVINTLEGRDFRDSLDGGLFGYGSIKLGGEVIPLLAYDWELIKGPKTADIYLLTGAIGNVRIWEGEHLSADAALDEFFSGNANGVTGADLGFFSTDGGRILGNFVNDNLCLGMNLWMSLRLFCKAPWAQARFQNVQCERSLSPLSPDPLETSFFPETSFGLATC